MKSAGYEAGNYAKIMVNDHEVFCEKNEHNHFRGLHIVVIHPKNGVVMFSQVFDTYKTTKAFE